MRDPIDSTARQMGATILGGICQSAGGAPGGKKAPSPPPTPLAGAAQQLGPQ